jgi:hypothetical protein
MLTKACRQTVALSRKTPNRRRFQASARCQTRTKNILQFQSRDSITSNTNRATHGLFRSHRSKTDLLRENATSLTGSSQPRSPPSCTVVVTLALEISAETTTQLSISGVHSSSKLVSSKKQSLNRRLVSSSCMKLSLMRTKSSWIFRNTPIVLILTIVRDQARPRSCLINRSMPTKKTNFSS